MPNLRQLEEQILADGKVDGPELERLHQVLYADGKIDRQEADFLVVLRKRVRYRTQGFDRFFLDAIKEHILVDGRIGAEETAWIVDEIRGLHRRGIAWEDVAVLHRINGRSDLRPVFGMGSCKRMMNSVPSFAFGIPFKRREIFHPKEIPLAGGDELPAAAPAPEYCQKRCTGCAANLTVVLANYHHSA